MLYKPKGYEAPEWKSANEIMRDQEHQISNLKYRLDNFKKREAKAVQLLNELANMPFIHDEVGSEMWDRIREISKLPTLSEES